MTARSPRETSTAVGGGIAAGALGGTTLSISLMLRDAVTGRDPWIVLKAPAYPFLGDVAVAPGFDLAPILWGQVIHFVIAIVWGVLFAMSTYGASSRVTIALGAVWGIIAWLVMHFVVLELFGMSAMVRGSSRLLTLLAHVIFGVSLGVGFLPFQRRGHRPIVYRLPDLRIPRVRRG